MYYILELEITSTASLAASKKLMQRLKIGRAIFQIQRELEDDNGFYFTGLTKKLATQSQHQIVGDKRKKKTHETIHEDELGNLAGISDEDYPHFLNKAGSRLATASKLLSRFSNKLIMDCGVPNTARDHCLHIFQLYLKHFKVAFCEDELDVSNPFCPIVIEQKYDEIKQNKNEERKAKKEHDISKGVNVLGHIFDMNVEIEDDAEISAFTELRTKLSKVAVKHLLLIPFTSEVMIVILYLACICSGATWILLSDITRWFREGRLRRTLHQRCALAVPCSAKKDENCNNRQIYPLFEYIRVLIALSQITEIPKQPVLRNIHQVISRFCFNLNLPYAFAHRVHRLCDTLKPSTEISAAITRRFGDFDSSEVLDNANANFNNYFSTGFEKRCQRSDFRKYSVLPSIEAKALALILFAFKLIFGLDGHREFNMVPQNSNDVFNFSSWFHQLKMRMEVWRGRPVQNVLKVRYRTLPSYDAIHADYRTMYRNADFNQISHSLLFTKRNGYFSGCIPNYVVQEAKDYALLKVFSDNNDEMPAKFTDKEAILTPLCFQATKNQEWFRNQRKKASFRADSIDYYNADIFFADFKSYTLDYHTVDANVDSTSNQKQVFPRPHYCGSLMRCDQSNIMYFPIIYTCAMDAVLSVAHRHFSDTFAFLFETFCLLIGEEQKVLYAFFLMIEMICLSRDRLEEIYNLADTGAEISMKGQCIDIFSRPNQYFLRLRRMPGDMSRADYAYNMITIDSILPEPSTVFVPFHVSIANLKKKYQKKNYEEESASQPSQEEKYFVEKKRRKRGERWILILTWLLVVNVHTLMKVNEGNSVPTFPISPFDIPKKEIPGSSAVEIGVDPSRFLALRCPKFLE
ncbi:unnamed protein product [Dracunculus medinensis]|uniref:C2H2-type domain-containing protein n=1 Tax=Dracunculus medinensis TaxID=318479 RepID=A0A158Q3I4_DRAME|nr:unnamed protein product [Dracunculus medinensis]